MFRRFLDLVPRTKIEPSHVHLPVDVPVHMSIHMSMNMSTHLSRHIPVRWVRRHRYAGFDGFVMSDWGATHSTILAANSGLDQEMPGGLCSYGPT